MDYTTAGAARRLRRGQLDCESDKTPECQDHLTVICLFSGQFDCESDKFYHVTPSDQTPECQDHLTVICLFSGQFDCESDKVYIVLPRDTFRPDT
ncbi:hypothetical protein J6590_036729 [Homalodisca vitripennis]|nr:hypothetical protein J6590_036729 [Homalodisca vitripennis]